MMISLSSASVAKHDNRFCFGEQGWKTPIQQMSPPAAAQIAASIRPNIERDMSNTGPRQSVKLAFRGRVDRQDVRHGGKGDGRNVVAEDILGPSQGASGRTLASLEINRRSRLSRGRSISRWGPN
jgi:hypothetical protein